MMDCFDLPRRRQQLTSLIQQYAVLKDTLESQTTEMLKISEEARQTAIKDISFTIEAIREEIRRIDAR